MFMIMNHLSKIDSTFDSFADPVFAPLAYRFFKAKKCLT